MRRACELRQVLVGYLCLVAIALAACSEGERDVGDSTGGTTRKARGGTTTGGTGSAQQGEGGSVADGGATAGEVRECGVVPVNPNASQAAKNLLCYLYELKGKSVLSGQQETSWISNPADDVDWIFQQTGTYPAILGGDYLYPNGTTQRARAWWNAGGIVMIRYHMGAPPASDTYEDSKGSADIDAVLTDGTPANRSFIDKLNYASKELSTLQNTNVPVIWAPLHEAQPAGWFWWSKGTGEQYVALWKYVYNYLTNVKGLNNLLWLMPFSGIPNAAFFPGKAYVDLAGPDTYAIAQPFAPMYSNTTRIVGTALPIPLHETGVVPNPDQAFATGAPWVLFNIWAGYEMNTDYNTVDGIKAAFASSYTITRDEVPNLR